MTLEISLAQQGALAEVAHEAVCHSTAALPASVSIGADLHKCRSGACSSTVVLVQQLHLREAEPYCQRVMQLDVHP